MTIQPLFMTLGTERLQLFTLSAVKFFVLVLILMFFNAVAVSAKTNATDPMQDKYSQEVRDAFAKCREEKNPMTQFFCNCRVLEQQCETPRRLEHGDWYTVEYWPSDDEAEREVQFVLFMDYDTLGEFAPIDTGLVMICMRGQSEVNVFIGENIDPFMAPELSVDDINIRSRFSEELGSVIVNFENAKEAFYTLSEGQTLRVVYDDLEGEHHEAEFELFGFDQVSQGWDSLCFSPES